MNQNSSYLKKLSNESVVQRVINCLTDAMIHKELRPGDKIPTELELSETLGVGRNSIREAIKILVYLGVLEIRRAEGTFVCEGFSESMIDPMIYGIILDKADSYDNLMELREMMESGVVRLAMTKYTEEDMQNLEENLYSTLEETMARLESMPEPEAVPYQKNDAKWEHFGILLSGIISTLNSHHLDRMDVEEHIPVMEQKIVSLVRRSWGIDGRSDLMDRIRDLARDGYILRYQLYSEASSPEELMDETMDEEDRESVSRAWRFSRRYKSQYAPGFMAGWDVGRAAMLTRWGCYLGWITESEAVGILWELSRKVVEELHSWREFAQSYLFGGLMWKLLCGDSSAGSYLGYLADAATDLLTGKKEQNNGQWRDCPWPAKRKIGFLP